MTLSECMLFLKELNRYDNIYVSIDNGVDYELEDYLLDDLTPEDLKPFKDKKFDMSFDGLHNGNELEPRFRLYELKVVNI